MVRVELFRGPDGEPVGFEARGHAGLAARGRDIVCAAVAAVVQTAALGLEGHGLQPEIEQRPGYLRCRLAGSLPPGRAAAAGAILRTMELGLREIERQYPRRVRVSSPPAAERREEW